MKDVLQEIYKLRERHNWTEYELAKRADIPQSTISAWYRKKQIPTLPNLEKICNCLGITLSQLLAEDGDMIELTPRQREMLDNWSALNEKQQEIVLELLKNM